MKNLKYFFLTCIFLCSTLSEMVQAQQPTDFLSSEFHQDRREVLRSKMPQNSVAVFFSNAVRNRANDVDYKYHQDPNFYYLTGQMAPHGLLMIFSEEQEANGKRFKEILFVRGRNALKELYEGARFSPEEAAAKMEMELVFQTPDFKDFAIDFGKFKQVIFEDFKE
ncbi:MAG: Xaa-Pro aminopeptidase, partial [Marivirga sp.]